MRDCISSAFKPRVNNNNDRGFFHFHRDLAHLIKITDGAERDLQN